MNEYSFDISIIVPCFNCEKYITKTIESIIEQKYDFNRIEILLINDGSTDGTKEIIESYNWENVVIINKENGGVSSARNIGITKARGKYILFLDSDDCLNDMAVSEIVSFFGKYYDSIDIVTYPIYYMDTKGKRISKHFRYKELYDKGTNIYNINEYYHCIQTTINVCIKNDKQNFFDENQSFSEDEKFNTSIVMKKQKIGYVTNARYYYRRHNTNVTKQSSILLKNFNQINNYYLDIKSKYENHPYIQNLILNQFRFRLESENLFFNEKQKNEIIKLLENIDINLIKEMPFMDIKYKLFILDLMKKKLNYVIDDKLTIMCDDIVIYEYNQIECEITNYKFVDNFLYLKGTILLPLFDDKISIVINKHDYVGNIEQTKPELSNSNLFFFDNCSFMDTGYKEITLKVNINETSEIVGELNYNKSKIAIEFKNSIFVPNILKYKKQFISINNNIKISKKLFFKNDKLKWKIRILIFLKHFYYPFKKIDLYYESEEGLIKKIYCQSKSKNKKLYFNNKSLRYKLALLRADKLFISDLNRARYLPFGKSNIYYSKEFKFHVFVYFEPKQEAFSSYMIRQLHPMVTFKNTSKKQKAELVKKYGYDESNF